MSADGEPDARGSRIVALAVPARAYARPRPWRVAGTAGAPGIRGRAYAEPAPELAEAVPRWLASRTVSEGTQLKAPDVFRVGALVVKFFTAPSLFGWLRPTRAVRSAERVGWVAPLRAPRPWLAAAARGGRPALLVREHVEGALLGDVFGSDPAAEEALAVFLAEMERRRVLHGDLHPRNLLWTGSEWVLLDVDGLRHALHGRSRVLAGQWARFLLHLPDEERVRALHRRTAELLAGTGPEPVPWDAVRARADALRARRARG